MLKSKFTQKILIDFFHNKYKKDVQITNLSMIYKIHLLEKYFSYK